MNIEQIIGLDKEIITVEQLEEIESNEFVENVEFNGISGQNECKWYSVFLTEEYITSNCDDSNEIQVYVK